jgi:hypothetical protein
VSSADLKIRKVREATRYFPVEIHALGETNDFCASSLTFHASIHVMLALEDDFDLAT